MLTHVLLSALSLTGTHVCSDVKSAYHDNTCCGSEHANDIIRDASSLCSRGAPKTTTETLRTGIEGGMAKMYGRTLGALPSNFDSEVAAVTTGTKTLRQAMQDVVYTDDFYAAQGFAERSADLTPTYLAGKVAVIAGGSSGAGFNLAIMLAELGCRVYVCGRTQVRFEHEKASAMSTEAELKGVKSVGDLSEFTAAAAAAGLTLTAADHAFPYDPVGKAFLGLPSKYENETTLYRLPLDRKLSYGGLTGVSADVFSRITMTEVDLRDQAQATAWLNGTVKGDGHSGIDYLVVNAVSFFGQAPAFRMGPTLVEDMASPTTGAAWSIPQSTVAEIMAATPDRWTNPAAHDDSHCYLMYQHVLIAAFHAFGYDAVKSNTKILGMTSILGTATSFRLVSQTPFQAKGFLDPYARGKKEILNVGTALAAAGFKSHTYGPVRLMTESGFAVGAQGLLMAASGGNPAVFGPILGQLPEVSATGHGSVAPVRTLFSVGSYDFWQTVAIDGSNYVHPAIFYGRMWLRSSSTHPRNVADRPMYKDLVRLRVVTCFQIQRTRATTPQPACLPPSRKRSGRLGQGYWILGERARRLPAGIHWSIRRPNPCA